MFGGFWTTRKPKQVVDDDSISTVTTGTKSNSELYYHKSGIDSGGLYIGQPNVPESIYEPLQIGRGRDGSFYSRQMKGHMNLLTACRNGSYTTVERLLKRGDDVNKTDCEQDHDVTPLHTALIHEYDAIVKLLLQHGADVHRAANNGWTPLHIAASNGRAEVVEWLLDCNADVEAKDSRGWTPLFVACFRGHFSVVRLLLLDKRIADTSIPQQVNWTDAHGQTPLMTACQRGHMQIVKILLQLGAQTYLQDEDGSTALNFAADGYPDIVMVLLEHDMIIKDRAMSAASAKRGKVKLR